MTLYRIGPSKKSSTCYDTSHKLIYNDNKKVQQGSYHSNKISFFSIIEGREKAVGRNLFVIYSCRKK